MTPAIRDPIEHEVQVTSGTIRSFVYPGPRIDHGFPDQGYASGDSVRFVDFNPKLPKPSGSWVVFRILNVAPSRFDGFVKLTLEGPLASKVNP